MQTVLRHTKKNTVEVKLAVDSLQEKLAIIEDKSRQSNIRLVGLKEGVEGDDPLGFKQNHLPKWITSLAVKVTEIERAHRIYSGERSKNVLQDAAFSRPECNPEWILNCWTSSSYGSASAFLPRL